MERTDGGFCRAPGWMAERNEKSEKRGLWIFGFFRFFRPFPAAAAGSAVFLRREINLLPVEMNLLWQGMVILPLEIFLLCQENAVLPLEINLLPLEMAEMRLEMSGMPLEMAGMRQENDLPPQGKEAFL